MCVIVNKTSDYKVIAKGSFHYFLSELFEKKRKKIYILYQDLRMLYYAFSYGINLWNSGLSFS